MSLQTAFVAIKTANTTLNALIATRFHPDRLPQNVVLPAVRFQKISKTYIDYAFGANPAKLAITRVQVDGYAATQAGRTTLAAALRSAFHRYQSSSIGGERVEDIMIDNEREDIELLDTATEAYRITIDFRVAILEA